MRARKQPAAQPAAPIWWPHDGSVGYIGAGNDGLEFRRHSLGTPPGLWSVAVTGWGEVGHAVIDDFGNLVKVRS